MKKSTVSLVGLALIAFTISCSEFDPIISPGRITGSGKLATQIRTMPDFHSVHMTTAGKVYVTLGAEQEVSVTVDDNIQEYVTTSVSGGALVIGIKPGSQLSNFDLTVNITITDLEGLSTSSAGSIESKNKFVADFVTLALSSAGSIRLNLEADELNSVLSSAGNLTLSGSVVNHQAWVSSAGNLRAFDMITDTTIVNVSSAGNAEVYVTKLLEATITSVGSVFYKGNPEIRQTVTSLGTLIDSN